MLILGSRFHLHSFPLQKLEKNEYRDIFFRNLNIFNSKQKTDVDRKNNLIKNIWKLRKVLNLTCSACKAS